MMLDRVVGIERRVTLAAAGVASIVVAVGLAISAQGGVLGTATPPFVMGLLPQASLFALPAAAIVAAAVVLGPSLLRAPRSPVAFAVAAFAMALALALAIGAARRGSAGWSQVFELGPGGSFEAKNEYLPGLAALEYGAWFFLDRFAELVPSLPVNVGAHPPGLMLVMHMLGIATAQELAGLCIACAAACAPLTYGVGRTLLDGEPAARIAALLAACSPVLLLFGTASADAVYAATGLLAAWLLVCPRPALRGLGCIVFALATLGSWALLAIGAWAAIVVWRREGLRAAVLLAAGCGLAVVALNGLLAIFYGYDAISTLLATEALYRNSLASVRPYAFWAFGSPVAWGVMLGPPIAAAALVAAVRGRPEAVALAVVLLIASVMGFTKAETERIWLPFVPLACVAAASVLPPGRLPGTLALLGLQAFAVELLFYTVW